MARAFLTHPITDDSAIGGQIIDGSVSFDRSLAKQHLRYTPSSDGNRRKFTISCWVKRSLATAGSAIMGVWVSNSNRMVLRFFDDGRLNFQYSNNATTKAKYKDVTAWYHIVAAVDTTIASPSADRVKIYVNSVRQELSAQDWTQNQETIMLDNVAHYIGARVSGTDGNVPDSWFDGYMTQFYIIDNQQLLPSDFGYTEGQTGIWRPKKYEGTFNTHSFYLPLDGSGKLGKDQFNNNDWASYNVEATISLDKATGGFPILNTNNSGTIAHPGLRNDPFGSYCVLAAPFSHNGSGSVGADRSNELNPSSTTKTITNGDAAGTGTYYNFYGGSMQFDGTNDYMTIADSDDFHFGAGDFCIECWVKPNSVSGSRRIFSQKQASESPDASLIFRTDNTKFNFYFQTGGGSDRIYLNSGVKDLVQYEWYHLAATREGNTFRTFVNGEIDQTGTYAGTMPNITDAVQIGRRENNSEFWSGQMQDLRIYKGVAKYTSNFVPAATNPHIVSDTPSGSAVTRKFKPNPCGSGYFDGNGDYLSLASTSDFDFGTGDFTCEIFFRCRGWSNSPYLFDFRTTGGSESGSIVTYINNSGTATFWYNGSNRVTSNYKMPLNCWVHLAVVRSSGTTKMYIDGVAQSSTYSDSNDYGDGGRPLFIGVRRNSGSSYNSQSWNGELSNARIVKGTAVYTSNFIPPKKPLEAITNTKLLCLQSTDNLTKAAIKPGTISVTNAYPHNINPFDNDTIGQESNYATLNAYWGYGYNSTFTEHGSKVSIPASNTYGRASSTISATKGKYYWEVTYTTPGDNGNYLYVGVGCISGRSSPYYGVRGADGEKGSSYGNSGGTNLRFGQNDVIGVYMDLDNGKWYVATNGEFQDAGNGVGNPELGTGYVHNNLRIPYYTVGSTATQYGDTDDGLGAYFWNATSGAAQVFHVNFGQKPFKYPPPDGYKTLSVNNLPKPSIPRPSKHFNTLTYTGNGATSGHHITGLQFAPDFVWIKNRGTTYDHMIYDTIRGVGNYLESSTNDAEANGTHMDGFLSNGFSVGNGSSSNRTNYNGNTYVGWCWKGGGSAVTNNDGSVASQVSANVEAGFSIVTYAGSGVRTVGHGLSKRPEMIIMKGRNVSDQWTIGHTYMNNAVSSWNYGLSFGNGSIQNNANFWNDTHPTDTVFTRGSWNAGYNMVSYCFHSVEGYSKVGWYIANANGNGPYVHCGFRPAFVMVKNEDNGGEEWVMYDNKRVTPTVNNVGSPNGATLYTGHNYAESDGNAYTGGNSRNVSFFSTGFKITDTGNPLNKPSDEGNHHIFFAIAEQPLTTQFGSQSNAQ